MKILVVNYRDRLHPAAGGAEKHLHRIFSKIVAMGHEVVLFTTMFPGAAEREVVDGIQVVRKGRDLTFQITVATSLRALDKEFHFDVVVEDLNKLPVFAHWFVKKPLLVQMHHLWRTSIFSETNFLAAFGVWFFERIVPLFYRSQPFAVVSPSTKKELAEIGVDESRISVIYNGSETVEPVVADEAAEPYFLWLSRIHKYKGIWVALSAFEKFSAKHPEVKLVVVGDGPLMGAVREWLSAHGLSDKVLLTGFVSSSEKRKWIAGSLALLQTSFKEGWGLTVMEAAQLEKMTIASNVPGLCDSVRDGETGILFASGDAEACAAAMESVYTDASLRERFGAAAKKYAQSFSWDAAAEQTLELLKKTMSGGV